MFNPSELLEIDPPRLTEETGQLQLWWNSDEPPDPDDFGGDTPEYQEAWQQWEVEHPELAEAIAQRNQLSVISHQPEETSDDKVSQTDEPYCFWCRDQGEYCPACDGVPAISHQSSANNICCSATDRVKWIDPNKIDLSGTTQTRIKEDRNHVEVIKQKIKDGEWDWHQDPLPELVWSETEQIYYVVSGHHRCRAALELGEEIYCQITEGTLDDAVRLAIRSGSNNNFILPESAEDLKKRIWKCLDLMMSWDNETLIRELQTIQPNKHCSEKTIKDAVLRITRSGEPLQGLSARLIASYVGKPGGYAPIGRLFQEYKTTRVYQKLISNIGMGDWVEFDCGGMQQGKVETSTPIGILITSTLGDQHLFTPLSPLEILQSIALIDKPESIPESDTDSEPEESDYTPPPPEPTELEETQEPEEYTPPPPVPVSDYAIAFRSNIQSMNSSHIASALEAICEWLNEREQYELMERILGVSESLKALT